MSAACKFPSCDGTLPIAHDLRPAKDPPGRHQLANAEARTNHMAGAAETANGWMASLDSGAYCFDSKEGQRGRRRRCIRPLALCESRNSHEAPATNGSKVRFLPIPPIIGSSKKRGH
jgi:hypothetical protein